MNEHGIATTALQNALLRVNAGVVHTYTRFFTRQEQLRDNCMFTDEDGQKLVFSSMISRRTVETSTNSVRVSAGTFAVERRATYRITVFIGLNDAKKTEERLNNVTNSILEELDGDEFRAELNTSNMYCDSPTVTVLGHAMWADTLCNQAEIQIAIYNSVSY